MKNNTHLPTILAIDTSCDDTSASIVIGNQVHSNIVSSQIALHQPYGGVFPTVAKLAHQQNITPVVDLALKRANLTFEKLDAIAVTIGPGLAPALEIGLSFAKNLAKQYRLPLIPVNHVEAHLLSPFLKAKTDTQSIFDWQTLTNTDLNLLAIVLSGGHSEFVWVKKVGHYQILGQTIDDAAGECLDKIGRLLGLGYPAAPVLEQLAKDGDCKKYPFPLPLTTVHNFNLSFSGLKTHAKNQLKKLSSNPNITHNLSKQELCDFCASTQTGVFNHVLYKLRKLFTQLGQKTNEGFETPHFVLLGGGVAANIYFRQELRKFLKQMSKNFKQPITLLTPYTKKICGDNASMIGLVGALKFSQQKYKQNLEKIERCPNLKVETWNEQVSLFTPPSTPSTPSQNPPPN